VRKHNAAARTGKRKVSRINNERDGKGKLETGGNQIKLRKESRSI
jgi:hypothetical protein